jgi:hypothetical protein
MTAGLLLVIVKLLFFDRPLMTRSLDEATRPTSFAIALAVSLLKIGDIMGDMLLSPEDPAKKPFFPAGDSGGLELFSLEDPNNLSWALNALPGLSS